MRHTQCIVRNHAFVLIGGRMRLQKLFASAVLAAVVAFPLALFAHHSRAHYGTDETTTTGTVIEYKWRNPHVFVVWEVKDQSGKSTQWVGEMASVTSDR